MKILNRLLALALVLEMAAIGLRWAMLPSPRLPTVKAVVFTGAMARELEALPRNIDPAKLADWERVGIRLRAAGMFPQAEYCYRQLNKLQPGNPDYLAGWATVLARLGRTQESTEKYNLAIQENHSQESTCWLGIGQNYLREENAASAAEALRKADSLPRANYLLCRLLYRHGEAAEAKLRLEKLLIDQPDGMQFHKLMAWTLGELQDAERHRQQSLRLPPLYMPDPSHEEDDYIRDYLGEETILNAALALEEKQQGEQGLSKLRAALEEAWSERTAFGAALIAFRLGKYEEARQLLEECLRRYGDTSNVLQQLGDTYARLADEAKARAAWLKAASLLGKPELYTRLADSFRRAGDAQSAARHDALARFEQGKQLWKHNALAEAKIELTAAAEALVDHAHCWFYLADTLRELSETEPSAAAYRKCLQINPDHGRAQHGLELLAGGLK